VKKSSKIDSASDNQKGNMKTLASIKAENDRRNSRLKLAILPMYSDLSPIGASYGSNADLQYAAISSLKHVLRTNEMFDPTYSFYDLGEEFDEKTIDKSVISDQFKKNLSIKESTWSDKEPNEEIIYELSNKLNIDLAVTFKFKYDNLIWDSSLYIIDVKNEKIFSRNESFAIYSLHPSLRNFTEKAFLDFEKDTF
jgi:hypothetical protein